MKKDKYQQACRSKILKLKKAYLLGKYQDLLIHDQCIYPPVEKDVQEVLISQFAFSLLDQFIRNYNEERFDKKNKLPLPIIFAIMHHHLKIGKYQNLIKIILHHIDRTTTNKYYIITYVVAKIYQRFQQYKKCVFYLQNVLKEQPFFYEAIYDLCYHYAYRLERQQQACILLERHIGQNSQSNKLILPLYISICSKFKVRGVKDVIKMLHNKAMNMTSYFNLGLFLRQNNEFEKAKQIFSEIIVKIQKAKVQILVISAKDQKLLQLSKINLYIILQISKDTNKSPMHIQSNSKQLNENKGYFNGEILQRLTQYNLKYALTQFPKDKSKTQLRTLITNRQQKENKKQYKKENTQNTGQIQNKQMFKEFNKQFSDIRQQNTKKLKYLLQKQKQISHFFKNLVIKKDSSNQKYFVQYKIKDKTTKPSKQSIETKAKFPNQYQTFQKEFQQKKKIHQFKYSNIELQSMLSQILINFDDSRFHSKEDNKKSINKQNLKIKPKISVRKQNTPQPSSSIVEGKSVQAFKKKNNNQKNIFQASKSKAGLNSERSGYFRIKQANRQKQIRLQKPIFDNQNKHVIFSQLNSPTKLQNSKLKTEEEKTVQVSRQQINSVQLKAQSEPQYNIIEPRSPVENIEIIIHAEKMEPLKISQRSENSKQSRQKSQQVLASQTNLIEPSQGEVKGQASLQLLEQPQESKKSLSLSPSTNQLMILQDATSNEAQKITTLQQKQVQQPKIHDPQEKRQKVIFEEQYMPGNSQTEHFNTKQEEELQINIADQITKNPQQPNIQQVKQMVEQPPIITNQIQPNNKQQNQIFPPPQYDPLLSTFQLTGFDKSSLGKFKKHQKKSIQLSNQFNFPSIQSKQKEKQSQKNSFEFEEQLKKVQLLEKQQKYEEAYLTCTKIYKIFKKQSEKQIVLIKIGSLFQKQQKFAEAEKTYLKCTKFNNVDAFLKLGALLINNGRINSGVESIEKANCIKRNDIEIQNRLVYGYSLRQQTMEKALTLAQMILKKQPQSLQTLVITANILQKQGKIKEAIQILTAIDKFKQAQYIKHYLGILYLQDSNLTEAFNYFKAALAIKPDYIPSLIQVATIISQISPKQSISILKKVLQVQPQNRKVLARLGKIYESIQNDFENAMVAYQTALQTQQNYESYIKIGDCLAKQQSYIEALINYKQALNLKKTHEAYAKVASMYQKKYELVKAIENYQLALELLSKQKEGSQNSIKRKEYLIFLGNLNTRIGNYQASIKFFEEVQDHIESIDLLKLLAEAYFGKKQYSMALQRFERANQLAHGDNLEILQKIAICFDKLEEYLASKPIYQKILEKDPNNIRCMNNLANILLIVGETNQSFYLFQSMLQKAPKNLQKRLKVADIYAEVGDWSKVQFHLLQCFKLKQNDERVIERLINLYKQKRDIKMANKYEKKLAIMRNTRKNQQKNIANA